MSLSDYAVSENSGDDSSETMDRRKFTLPPDMNDHLEDLAEVHYSGSVSQYIRAAIKDHERTLNGQDEFAYKELKSEVEVVKERVEEIKETLEEEQSQTVDERAPARQTSPRDTAFEEVGYEAQRKVQSCLLDSETQRLTLEDIIEQSGLDPLKAQQSVKQLVAQGFIDRTSKEQADYYQIGVFNK